MPATSAAQARRMRTLLQSEFAISAAQIAEAASYSMAMVVRYALGLNANEGRITTFAADTLDGLIALATIRHLVNAGCSTQVFIVDPLGKAESPELAQQLTPLRRLGVAIDTLRYPHQISRWQSVVGLSHNAILGLADLEASESTLAPAIIDSLNETRTPVHSVDAPYGLDLDSGTPGAATLFSSSTLSLGLPYRGLFYGHTHVGRHYVCDISLPRPLYEAAGYNLAPLFAEQPVVQIYPNIPPEPEE